MAERFVRRRGGFSDRNNIKPISKIIQVDDFTKETRIVLKNEVINLLDLYYKSLGIYDFQFKDYIAKEFAVNLFCIPLDSNDAKYGNVINRLYRLFDDGDYDEILDAIEFVSGFEIKDQFEEANYRSFELYNEDRFLDIRDEFNSVFEEECIGYRFVDQYIVSITNNEEIKSIEESVNTKYEKVNRHIENALKHLSSKTNRNYKGVITECCHALECLMNIVLGTEGLVLSDALKKYCAANKRMHTALKDSIIKFYGYASDGAGLRHDTNNEDYHEGYEEAKLVLINTSGIINYIISIS